MTTTRPTVDIDALTRAIESRDADGVLAFYADDATLTLVDRDHPPSAPTVLTGRDRIAGYYTDICGRNMDHQVHDAVATPDRLAYAQHCRYPDGTRVLCVTVATVRDGKIRTQTATQAWDS
ncbi:MAG TPA: nuclear transport factor 2 family protein [Actinoplanes sp.]|nr:nuclear transport factor 2 family protein [Actinoplanes sp.]